MAEEMTGGTRNQRWYQNHPDYGIDEIDLNTEENLGDLRRLAVTQPPVLAHQLMLVGKTCKQSNDNNNIPQNHKIHHKRKSKLQVRIDSRGTIPRGCTNQKWHVPRRLTFTTTTVCGKKIRDMLVQY